MKKRYVADFMLCVLVALGLAAGSCKKQELASDAADVAGVYALVSVNGNPVPTSVSHEGVKLQVLSGSFIIKADGTCSTKTVFVPPAGSEVAREVAATYTKDGSQMTMQWEGAGITVGTVEGNTFTMDNEGMVFVYKK